MACISYYRTDVRLYHWLLQDAAVQRDRLPNEVLFNYRT